MEYTQEELALIQKRDFIGIWIPKAIYLDRDLSFTEKALLIEIDSLDNSKKGCFAKNEYFAFWLNKSAGTIQNMISKLKSKGFIEQVYFDGRLRGLRSIYHTSNEVKVRAALTNPLEQVTRKRVVALTKTLEQTIKIRVSYIISNNYKNITKTNTSEEIEISRENAFNVFWKLYAYSKSKDKAKRIFIKLKAEEIESIISVVEDYTLSTPDKKFRKHPATWLNQRSWEDEIFVPKKRTDFESEISNQFN